jgi:pimeloyl-ACP methyl ester carboxylesterase
MSISASLGEVHEVRVGDATIRYRERGTGPAIVFVHGLLVNGDLWRGVASRLADQYRVITPDWPLGSHEVPLGTAFDRSPMGMAHLIAGFLDALDLTDVTLVGNDTGGALTQLVMIYHPERVARAVLTPCDAFDNFLPAVFKPLQWFGRWTGFWRMSGWLLRSRALQRLPMAFGWLTRRPIPQDIMDSYLNPSREEPAIRQDLSAFVRRIDVRVTMAAGERLHEFAKPVLIAWADTDRCFPREDARRLAARLPDSRLEFIPDSYPFVPEDAPGPLADSISRFLGSSVV